jgi:hypothetical protein
MQYTRNLIAICFLGIPGISPDIGRKEAIDKMAEVVEQSIQEMRKMIAEGLI